jgi:subtilisin family serine protease
MIEQLVKNGNGPLLLAAAGNQGAQELSFPARFSQVIAIASINLAGELSAFSNRGTTAHKDNSVHPNVFVLPGGEKLQGNSTATEYIGISPTGTEHYGTSFSTAYASGLIAALWAEPQHSGKDRDRFLDHLRLNADKNLPDYNSATHGNGMMRFV